MVRLRLRFHFMWRVGGLLNVSMERCTAGEDGCIACNIDCWLWGQSGTFACFHSNSYWGHWRILKWDFPPYHVHTPLWYSGVGGHLWRTGQTWYVAVSLWQYPLCQYQISLFIPPFQHPCLKSNQRKAKMIPNGSSSFIISTLTHTSVTKSQLRKAELPTYVLAPSRVQLKYQSIFLLWGIYFPDVWNLIHTWSQIIYTNIFFQQGFSLWRL